MYTIVSRSYEHKSILWQVSIELFCCDEDGCLRAYCKSCCDMLLTPRQSKLMKNDDAWVCCHCMPSPGSPASTTTAGKNPRSEKNRKLLALKAKGGSSSKVRSNKSKDKPLKLTAGEKAVRYTRDFVSCLEKYSPDNIYIIYIYIRCDFLV